MNVSGEGQHADSCKNSGCFLGLHRNCVSMAIQWNLMNFHSLELRHPVIFPLAIKEVNMYVYQVNDFITNYLFYITTLYFKYNYYTFFVDEENETV